MYNESDMLNPIGPTLSSFSLELCSRIGIFFETDMLIDSTDCYWNIFLTKLFKPLEVNSLLEIW